MTDHVEPCEDVIELAGVLNVARDATLELLTREARARGRLADLVSAAERIATGWGRVPVRHRTTPEAVLDEQIRRARSELADGG